MTKFQHLLIKLTRQLPTQQSLPLDNEPLLKLRRILMLKTWAVYRKEIDGIDYAVDAGNREEYIFLPNYKAHHQFTNHPGGAVVSELISWHLHIAHNKNGVGTLLSLNGMEYWMVTISDTMMVWVVDGVFLYLQPSQQVYQGNPSEG